MFPNLLRTGALEAFDPQFILALALGLSLHAAGEAVGYAFGTGGAVRRYAPLELSRAAQLRPDELVLAFE